MLLTLVMMMMMMMMTCRLATTVERDVHCPVSSLRLTCVTFRSTSVSLARRELDRQPTSTAALTSFRLSSIILSYVMVCSAIWLTRVASDNIICARCVVIVVKKVTLLPRIVCLCEQD